MDADRFRFDAFLLEPGDRRLSCDGTRVDLNARYLDALALLVREGGHLVSKDRFMDEVWRGVPVTDEALTQCIRTLRRQLGDDASRPRFIETVPKYGYRFIAAVKADDAPPTSTAAAHDPGGPVLLLGAAGTLGAMAAGAIGGLVYGFAAATQPGAGGAMSVMLVLLALTTLLALIGGAGVAFGIAAAERAGARRDMGRIVGGAAGGFVVGALAKLVGLDAFSLLLGAASGDFTGAAEGALLGGTVGIAAWFAGRAAARPLAHRIARAALAGGIGGAAISLLGGRLFAGSLAQLADHLPASRLDLAPIGAVFGERGLGPVSQVATAAFEGALFSACIVGAMLVARRRASGG